MDGLHKYVEVVPAVPRALEQIFNSGLARQEQDSAMGMEGANLNGNLDASDSGHNDIANENVGNRVLSPIDCD